MPVGVPDVVPVGVPWARRAGDVAPCHGCAHGVRVRTWHALADMARGVVGADVPGGPHARWRLDGVPWARRAEDVAPYHGCAHGVRVRTWRACADMAWGVVGADVLGGPRARGRPRWRARGRPLVAARRGRRALPWVRAWRACADVACVGGHGAGRGRGRRPRRPARPWASSMARPWASSGRVAWLRPYGGLDILPTQHACPVV